MKDWDTPYDLELSDILYEEWRDEQLLKDWEESCKNNTENNEE